MRFLQPSYLLLFLALAALLPLMLRRLRRTLRARASASAPLRKISALSSAAGGTGDRIALVAFTGRSLILSYLTEDAANVHYYLDYLRRDGMPGLGTNIGRALNNGLTVLTKEREVNPAAAAHKQVFILVSDGDDHGGALAEAVANVKNQNIKVHTIAVGSPQGAPIPVAWDNGRAQYLLDGKGERVISRLDEGALRWLAQETGGGAYRAVTGDELPQTIARIIESEREIAGFRQVVQLYDLHEALLFAAFGLLLGTILIRGARV